MASVLIVDDEPDVRNSLKIFLRPSKHDVTEASDAQGALTLMAETDKPSDDLATAISASSQAVLKLKGVVTFVPPGSLPNDGKVIADDRALG